jgi:hypothetical protein
VIAISSHVEDCAAGIVLPRQAGELPSVHPGPRLMSVTKARVRSVAPSTLIPSSPDAALRTPKPSSLKVLSSISRGASIKRVPWTILTVNGRDYRKWELARSATLPVVGDRAVGGWWRYRVAANGGGGPLARLF